jgi:ComEC/Rec2-related protein
MHLGVITGIALGIFGILGRRKLAAAGAGCVVVGYLFLAGCRPSLLRAAVMVLVGTAAVVTGRKVEGRLVLGTSFLVVCAVMPWSMESLSFTLSFAAVAGIVLTADRFDGFLKRYLPSGVSGALAVSLASQLFTAPILIRSFGTLYPGGLIAAIPVGILAAIYLGMGLLFVMIPGPTGLAAWRCGFDIVHRGMIECTDIASRIPGIRCPPIPSLLIWGGTAAAVLALIYGGDLRVRIERIGRSAQVSIQRPKIGGRGAHKKGIGSDQEVRAKFSRR